MNKARITQLHQSFESYIHNDDGVDFWFARDLQKLLGYAKWDSFLVVVQKAAEACGKAGGDHTDHFSTVERPINEAPGDERTEADIRLTRYACYLVVQNSDSEKQEVAFAQTYFAIQTRRAELIEARLKDLRRIEKREHLAKLERRLAGIIFERGVDSPGFARIKSRGDEVLFGGNTTQQMKDLLRVPAKRPLADFLPAVTLTAKALADEITEHNLLEKDLSGEAPIASEHEASNQAVRRALLDRDVIPEKLPPAEDIKKLQARVKSERKLLSEQSKAQKFED